MRRSTHRVRSSIRARSKRSAPSRAITYNGPVSTTKSMRDNTRTMTTMLRYYSTVTTTAGGVINTVYGNAPSSCVDWSNFANCYDEYRVLGFKVHYAPHNIYSKTSQNCQNIITAVDNDSGGAIASYNAMTAYESAALRSVEKPFNITAKMSGVTQSTFITTAAPVANQWIKFYGDTFANSSIYGAVLIEFLVQFRGQN
jgi:hypothetical protein